MNSNGKTKKQSVLIDLLPPLNIIVKHLADRHRTTLRAFCTRAVLMYSLGLLRRDIDDTSRCLWREYQGEYLLHAGVEAYDAAMEEETEYYEPIKFFDEYTKIDNDTIEKLKKIVEIKNKD